LVRLWRAAKQQGRKPNLREILWRGAKLGAVFIVPILLYGETAYTARSVELAGTGLSSNGPIALLVVKEIFWNLIKYSVSDKLVYATGSVVTYNHALDALAWWKYTKRLATAPFLTLIAAALVVAYIFLPNELLDATWIDQRPVMLFGFVIFATTCPVALRRREALIAGIVFGAIFVARIGVIASV
jgi:hypothetical protein